MSSGPALCNSGFTSVSVLANHAEHEHVAKGIEHTFCKAVFVTNARCEHKLANVDSITFCLDDISKFPIHSLPASTVT